MLTLKNIVKNYTAGDSTVTALKGISFNFRKSEFVSILGPSGCGKTTLLNIIGGLDRYTSGDLVINGRSTKDYKDRDWDSYRNHSVGFVFQSYNLIPHQSVLSNVELALTLSGVSKEERRRRATEALQKVGLGDQLHKRPNQMSGGQMQRVAIARALVNDPDILLADEPTGALDSETSLQIMEILKEISADKLIIMVTHNPELADTYSSRIIRLLDGEVIDDSNPYEEEEEVPKKEIKEQKKPSMSFFTAVSLSFNNLLTKKARTFLTSFAGSIGIIGIALILALSTGVNAYIDSVQKDTLSSYPISIQSESMDATELLEALMQAGDKEVDHKLDKVYGNTVMHELVNALNNTKVQQNNLKKFKEFLDKETKDNSKTGLDKLITSVEYGYDLDLNIYTKDTDGKVVKADMEALITDVYGIDMNGSMTGMSGMSGMAAMSSSSMSSFASMNIWDELLAGDKSNTVNQLLKEQYDVIYGSWPTKYNEVVLVVDQNNEISDLCLYALGLKTVDQLRDDIEKSSAGETLEIKEQSWSYKEICEKTFRLVPSFMRYSYNNDSGEYMDLDSNEAGLNYLYDEGVSIKIKGIVRLNPDASSGMLRGSTIGYTPALTEYIVDKANENDLVKKQLKNPETDVFTDKPFLPETAPSDEERLAEIKEHLATLSAAEKADFYRQVMSVADEEYLNSAAKTQLEAMKPEEKKAMLVQAAVSQMGMSNEQAAEYINNLDEATIDGYVSDGIKKSVEAQYAQQTMAQLSMLPDAQAATMLDSVEDAKLLGMYDTLFADKYSESDYKENLKKLGFVDMDVPSNVNIYAATFEDKEAIADIISDYNDEVEEDDKIAYTDIMAQVMSSFTTIINAITYVLIAFVSISLIVSSIMIGIITYISVLERTKEIGVLRAIGASKRDISRVFNAETLIIGFASGVIGIGSTLLLCIPINAIVHALTGIETINAILPADAAAILVAISMVLTFISGLIPSKIAAGKDPVVALRSE